MLSQQLFERFRRELIRRGVPRPQAGRAARELADHWTDLMEEALERGRSAEEAEAFAQRTLGDWDQLAAGLKASANPATIWRRYSVVMFFGMPVLLFNVLFASLLSVGAAIGFMAGWWGHESRLDATGWTLIQMGVLCAQVASMAGTQAVFCRLASKHGCGPRCALFAVAALSIHSLVHHVTFTAPAFPGRGSLLWSYGLSADVSGLLLPLVCLAVFRLLQRPAPEIAQL